MQIPNNNSDNSCAGLDRYLDGNISGSGPDAFRTHLEECEDCRVAVELHRGMDAIPEEIELPADFPKVVAANAESQVSGLRKRRERKAALLIIAGLAALMFVLLGANVQSFAVMLIYGVEQLAAFFGVIGKFLFDFIFGIVVILKVAATNLEVSNFAAAVGFLVLLFLVLAYFLFTWRVAGLRDAKR